MELSPREKHARISHIMCREKGRRNMKKKFASILAIAMLAVSLAGCGSDGGKVVMPNEDGYAEGKMGDTMRNSFFDYSVNSAYICDTYGNYIPQDGYELLVADMTVKNTFGEPLPMFDSDFQVHWDPDAADAFDYPITFYLEDEIGLGNEMLPKQYDLAEDESRTGLLVFEVPVDGKEFSISYMEYFDDNTSGDTFYVFFDAEKK